MPKLVALILLIACTAVSPVAAGAAELSLGDAIGASLSKNLTIDEERLLVEAARAELLSSKGEFDPAVKASFFASGTRISSVTSFISRDEKAIDYEAGIGGKLKIGTGYDLTVGGSRIEASATPFLLINPYYASGLTLSITQPLLKDFGPGVPDSRIKAAQETLSAARLQAEHRAISIVAETASAYWDLYYSRKLLEVAELSLRLSEETLREVEAKIESGTLPAVEVYEAQAEAAMRRKLLVESKKALYDAEDRLRAVMNTSQWHEEVVPMDSPPGPGEAPTLDNVLAEAFEHRRDLKQAEKKKKSKEIMANFYKNQRLPGLNLTAAVGTSGVAGSFGNSWSQTAGGDFYNWKVGLALELPLGNRTAKGAYAKSLSQVQLADLSINILKQRITLDVREALRALELAEESLDATTLASRASEKRLQAEQERFKIGMATLNDVLRFQRDYSEALASRQRASADYAIASVELRRTSGTLLKYPAAASE